jgi:hypothetical protein
MTNSHDIPSPNDFTSPRDEESDRVMDRDAPSVSPLDEERVASMADEGGVSGALMDIDDPGERQQLMQTRRPTRVHGWRMAALGVALLGLGVIAVSWLRRHA